MTKLRQNRAHIADKYNDDNDNHDDGSTEYPNDDPNATLPAIDTDYVADAAPNSNADFYDDDDEYDDDITMKSAAKLASSSSSSSSRKTKFNDDDSYEDDDSGSGGKFSNDDNEDDDDDDSFFASKRMSNKGRFGNDAIKIISTPLGKVGFVYEQPQTPSSSSSSKSTPTDFDSLSPASVSGRHSTHPKITPVLTADGKVALLYRGDSESVSSSKYEPIKNFTNTFNLYDNKTSVDSKLKKIEDSEEDMGWDEDDEEDFTENSSSENNVISNKSTNTGDGLPTVTAPPLVPLFDQTGDNAVLPNINRPLSEVLGIKKNQFKQFRIKDDEILSSTTQSNILPPFIFEKGGESKSLNHDNPAINMGVFYGSRAAVDFDFGRDATMQDGRLNQKLDEEIKDGNLQSLDDSEDSTMSPQDVLSKTEVVNLAIIPHFDEDFEQQQHLREQELRRHHRQRHRHRRINEDISNIHCIMQAMMAVAAISTVFGMLGAMFKHRILEAIRAIHW